MLLNNSTTIWHHDREKLINRQKSRPVFGFLGMLEATTGKVVGASKWTFDRTLGLITSRPAKIVAKPIIWAYQGYKKAEEYTINKAKLIGQTGIEASKAVVDTRNSIARSLAELSGTTLRPVYHLMVKNTGDVIKGTFGTLGKTITGGLNTLGKIVKSPITFLKLANSTRKRVTDIILHPVKSLNNTLEWSGDKVNNLLKFTEDPAEAFSNIKGTIGNIRNKLKDRLSGGINSIWSFSTIPSDVTKNVKNAIFSVPESFQNAGNHLNGAIQKVKNSPNKAAEAIAKKKAEIELANKEKENEERVDNTKKQVR